MKTPKKEIAASKHTPGPWNIGEEGQTYENCWSIENEQGPVAHVEAWSMEDKAQKMMAKANAALIAAAPDMLYALKCALELVTTSRQYFPKSIKNMDRFALENTCATIGAAIAKAEGRTA